MDTMGDEATYAWVLEGRTIRVSLGDQDSNTYFQATLNEDNSKYVGTWHYPEGGPPDANETIVYTRVGPPRLDSVPRFAGRRPFALRLSVGTAPSEMIVAKRPPSSGGATHHLR